jgi:hypothetical protein
MTLDFTEDDEIWDNTEAVVLTTVRANGLNDNLPIATAVRRELTRKEILASNGVYTGQDVAFEFKARHIGSVKPKPRDRITGADGINYTVGQASYEVLDATWVLVTRNLALAADLRDLVTIQVPTISQDERAGKVKTWSASQTNIAARVQPVQADVIEERGTRGLRVTHVIVLDSTATAADLTNTNGDLGRISFGGRYYEITGYRHAEEIWELLKVDAALVP